MSAPTRAELAAARRALAGALADVAAAETPAALAVAILRADAAREYLGGLEAAYNMKRAADLRRADADRRERNRAKGLTVHGKPRKPKRTPEEKAAARVKAQAEYWTKRASELPKDGS